MKKLLSILLFLFTLSVSYGRAPSLYPGVAEIHLNNGRGQGSFLMFNTGESTKKYKVTVRDVDNQGNISVLSDHLKVFPRYVEIKPGENKKVRFLIRDFPEGDVDPGEQRASISIEELDSVLEQKHKTMETASGISTLIKYKYNINMAVYGYVGDLIPKAEVTLENTGENLLTGTIANKGNYSYPVSASFLDGNDRVIDTITLPKLMEGAVNDIEVKLPEGSTKVRITEGKSNALLYERDLNF